ncbi:hypothetical protein LUZ60_013826 [Juncus effusus]|nr:hypothetical protein LUZ60_013826 [Juncus effusus]
MEDSAAILHQISSLKEMLDQVNEEIEHNIQKTRNLESEIVKHSEIEEEYLKKEDELTKLVLIAEFELSGLTQVVGSATASLDALESNLKLEKINYAEMKRKFSDKMEKFTSECGQFQASLTEETKELTLLLEGKAAVEKESSSLKSKLNTLHNSTNEYIAAILEEIYTSCSILEADIKKGVLEYKSVLKDIENLKVFFANTIGSSSH